MTNDTERRLLLCIARDAIRAYVNGVPPTAPHNAAAASGDITARVGAAFVTIHCKGELRGCIGRLEATEPLAEVVRDCALSACSADPRFSPIASAELSALEIELSVLGPLERAETPTDIEIGRHGLLVEHRNRRGLLLPQVAAERHWDSETFLAQTCRKAGLPPDAWRNGATVWRFEAEVFGEG